jgi:hypothetical protein
VSTVGTSASSTLSLLVVTVNQLPGGDPPLPSFPSKDSSPWMALDDGTWSSDVREVCPLAPREVVIFGEF